MLRYPRSLDNLVNSLAKLPGIGSKTALRLSMFILNQDEDFVKTLADSLTSAKSSLRYCNICGNLSEDDKCELCQDMSRDRTTICVVEQPQDAMAIERTHEYRGLYHIIHGCISPVNGFTPDKLNIHSLITRLQQDDSIQEVIIATNPSIEGEATSMYLARLIKPSGIKVTRIAHGLPIGSDIEYADEITILKAVEERVEL